MLGDLLCMQENDLEIQLYIVEAYVLDQQLRLLNDILLTLGSRLPKDVREALENLKEALEMERDRIGKHVDIGKLVINDYLKWREKELEEAKEIKA